MSLRSGGVLDGWLFVCEFWGWGRAGAWRAMGVGGYNNTQTPAPKISCPLFLPRSRYHTVPPHPPSAPLPPPNHQQQLPLPSLLSHPPILFPIPVVNLTVAPSPLSLSSFWLGWVGLAEME